MNRLNTPTDKDVDKDKIRDSELDLPDFSVTSTRIGKNNLLLNEERK